MFLQIVFFSVKAEDNRSDVSKIDEFVNKEMKTHNIRGASIGIVKGQQIYYLKGYGTADNNGTLVSKKTPFILGSVSKSFTALAIMQLRDEGKIDIDAPVQKYLPWFRIKDESASKKITVRNLLNHTSGLKGFDNEEDYSEDDMPLEQFVRSYKNTNITKPVGSEFQYSNIGYDALGEIIQVVAGMTYEKYIEKNIFEPLQMKNSYTSQKEAKEHGLATGYQSYFGFMLPENQRQHTGNIPAGFLMSTSEDMTHYLIAQMNDGKYKENLVSNRDSLDEMHSPSVATGYRNSYASFYGMGWLNNKNGVIWHNGGTENFISELWMDKSNNVGVVMLFNCSDVMTYYDDMPQGILSILKGNSPDERHAIIGLRQAANIIAILVVLFSVMAIYSYLKWRKKLKTNNIWLCRNIIFLAILNLTVPMLIILYVPKAVCVGIFDAPIVALPDIALTIVVLPVNLIIIGIIKIVTIIKYCNSLKKINIV